MTDAQQLEHLFHARHACVSVVTNEEEHALRLIRDYALHQGRELLIWSVVGGVRDGLVAGSPPVPDTEHPAAGLYYMAEQPSQAICVTLDLADHLSVNRVLRLLRNTIRRFRDSGRTLLMIDHLDQVPPVIMAEATRFEISLPDEKELDILVRETLRQMNREQTIEIDITRRALQTIIRNLRGLSRRQAQQIIMDTVAEDRRFDANDVNTVLARKRQALHSGGLLEYIEAPVDLDHIGGLSHLKHWLSLRSNTLTEEATAFGLGSPRGVLMLGVQGAGKSLCAKAIATAWHRPLLRMDPCALYDRYVGESERRLRDALRQAETMAPIVLWIDEIEKAFASAASRSTDGGLSQRMFGTLLTWMQEHQAPVFLVATANDIEALPPELLRKGRFDEIFFVDLPCEATRREILAIHLRKRKRLPEQFDLDALAAESAGYSGAELEAAIVAALHDAFAAGSQISTDRVLSAIRDSSPLSVTMAESVQGLRDWARTRCVPAD